MVLTRIATGLLAGGSLLAASLPASAEDFYKDKTISVIVGFAPGGGMDTVGRLFARNFARHVDGKPNFVIQNMPAKGRGFATKSTPAFRGRLP